MVGAVFLDVIYHFFVGFSTYVPYLWPIDLMSPISRMQCFYRPGEWVWVVGRDVKRLSVYRLSFIFLVLVFEFQKPIIVSNLVLSSS